MSTGISAVLVTLIATDASVLSSLFSSLMRFSISAVPGAASSCSTFLLFHRLPFGAGSNGVLQYVTVLVTTCLTLTLPGWPLVSALASLDSNEALQGAELSGVEIYGDAMVCAEPSTGEKGDCGMWSLRGVRADLSAGFMNCEGGIVTRGESGRALAVLAALVEDAELPMEALLAEDVVDSYDILRDSDG